MERSTAFFADKPAANSLHETFRISFNSDNGCKSDSKFMEYSIKSRRLCSGSWESVKNPAFFAVILRKPFLNNADSHAVRYERSFIHITFGFFSEGGPGFYCRAEHITGSNLGDTIITNEFFRLRAFSCTGRSH